MILYVNACVREASRTARLAGRLLSLLGGPVKEVKLEDLHFPKADEAFLRERDRLIAGGAWDDPMFGLARDFAAADTVVVAAPFWDLSFPAALKQYFEQINVTGLTFTYTEAGLRQGLCRADRLYYVTTAGGPVFGWDYGFGYVKALAQTFYGIPEVRLVKAEGLDIAGADAEGILKQAMDGLVP